MILDLQFFGGRGASSFTPSGSNGKWSNGAGLPNIETMGEALGTRGKPMSMAKAMTGANPNYDSTGTYREFTENCQRCIVANEARRRGYKVVAQPTYDGDTLPAVAYTNPNTGVKNAKWQGAFRNSKQEKVGAHTGSQVERNIDAKTSNWGEGSRGVLQVFWKGGGGHVINIERKNGKTYYNDAQSGKTWNKNELFSRIRPGSAQVVRTDNLKFSDRVKNFIEPEGRR